jgi:predicted acyl esterase
MKPILPAVPFLGSVVALAFAIPAMAQDKTRPPATYPELPSEIPAKFKPVTDSFDSTRRNVMIPMRDGVKLHTVLLIPKGA